jgi:transcriptional regulator with XRE-family HTH domain
MRMFLVEIGHRLRKLRQAANLTQGQLASLAGVARETVSRIESGTYNDIGVKKLHTLLGLVGGELVVQPTQRAGAPDYVRRAVSAANISLRERLHADELVQALITGKAAPNRAGHVQAALEELSEENLAGLVDQVGRLAGDRTKVSRGLERLRAAGKRL